MDLFGRITDYANFIDYGTYKWLIFLD